MLFISYKSLLSEAVSPARELILLIELNESNSCRAREHTVWHKMVVSYILRLRTVLPRSKCFSGVSMCPSHPSCSLPYFMLWKWVLFSFSIQLSLSLSSAVRCVLYSWLWWIICRNLQKTVTTFIECTLNLNNEQDFDFFDLFNTYFL